MTRIKGVNAPELDSTELHKAGMKITPTVFKTASYNTKY